MSASGAPAATSAAETASVRGVAFGWAKVAVSMTMPGHERRREGSLARRERDAEPGARGGRPSRRSPRRRGRSSRSARSRRSRRGDRRPPSATPRRARRGAGRPRRSARATRSRTTTRRSYAPSGSGSVRNASMPGRKRRRRAVGRCRRGWSGRRARRRGCATASEAPSVSASGFSWLTARTRRAAAMRSTTGPGTSADHGPRSIEAVIPSSASPPRRGPSASSGGRLRGRPRTRPRRRRIRRRPDGSGSAATRRRSRRPARLRSRSNR